MIRQSGKNVSEQCIWGIAKSIMGQSTRPSVILVISQLPLDLYHRTHWGRDKRATVSQTTLSNAFSWMKMLEFRFKILLKHVPKGPINNNPALVQMLGWRRSGDRPLSEPMIVSLLTPICVTRPQWVKVLWIQLFFLWCICICNSHFLTGTWNHSFYAFISAACLWNVNVYSIQKY